MPPSCKLLATVYALDVIKGKITQTDVGRDNGWFHYWRLAV